MALQLDIANLTLVQNEDRFGKLIISLVNALVAKGWTVEGTGDGKAAFENSGQTAGPYNVFTSGLGYVTGGTEWTTAGGAGGNNSFSNPRAWIRIREPSPSTREFIFQRSNNASLVGYALYMIAGIAYNGYLAGGANATTPPTTVGDAQFLTGSAWNGAGNTWGTYNVLQAISAANTIKLNVMISDTARAGNVWPFYFTAYDSTAGAHVMSWIYESLVGGPTGDPDPLLVKTDTFALTFGAPKVAPLAAYLGRHNSSLVTNLGLVHPISSYGTFPAANMSVNPLDSKLRSFPVFVWQNSTSQELRRHKGRMEHFKLNMETYTYPDTHLLASADPKIYLGALMGDWETGVVPGT